MTKPETPAVKTRPIGEHNGHQLHETTDGQGSLYATLGGSAVVGGAWGPAADRTGNWFAYRSGAEPVRVASRDAAVDYITSEEK